MEIFIQLIEIVSNGLSLIYHKIRNISFETIDEFFRLLDKSNRGYLVSEDFKNYMNVINI